MAVITRHFGLEHIEIAEDITSETFLLAAETWGKKGIPENPSAWLYTVAKNKAKDYLKHHQIFSEKVAIEIQNTHRNIQTYEPDLSNENIKDSELRMLFAICHPCLTIESQIGLALRILFGLGIEEIAEAFLSNKEAINKRLHRAKDKLKKENVSLEIPNDTEINHRLSAVHATLYLLFNEGYHSTTHNRPLRKEICFHALYLAHHLAEYKKTNTPDLNALISLMCFHASRFEARIQNGEPILWEDQEHSLWNQELINTGEIYLNRSARGDQLSKYHLEAAIAYWHTQTHDEPEKWQNILQYYNILLQIEYSSIAALNRTYALFKVEGPQKALVEIRKLGLEENHLYHALLGHLFQINDSNSAITCFEESYRLAKTEADKKIIQNKIDILKLQMAKLSSRA